LNKVVKEKKTEASREQGQDNNDAEEYKQQVQPHLSLAAQAYKLFSEGQTPLEVAIALNLRESEATKFYKEYWNLKQLHNLNMFMKRLKVTLNHFKLYRLSKAAGMSARHVINLLKLQILTYQIFNADMKDSREK
jgi:hypothetical protein